jgi:hypothetical protein
VAIANVNASSSSLLVIFITTADDLVYSKEQALKK